MSGTCILFFLKYPAAGKVKTRLAATLGNEKAMKAFCWMVETAWKDAVSKHWERQVCGTPETHLTDFDQWLSNGRPAKAQSVGDLGDRLIAGISGAFSEGFEKVICVGGDCVQLGFKEYSALSEALENNDAAILPAHDGGYVAIGLKAPQPLLFQNIAWSSDSVFEDTLNAAKSADLSVWIGETFTDVDTLEDWSASGAPNFPGSPQLTPTKDA